MFKWSRPFFPGQREVSWRGCRQVDLSWSAGHQDRSRRACNTLGSERADLVKTSPPLVVLMVGLQGSGKTTTAAKLAKLLPGPG